MKFYKFNFKICHNEVKRTTNTPILNKFRELMKQNKYNAYILTNTDPHKNEYLAEKDKKLKFISNFSGSNALVIITDDKAVLWTDSRYYIQAENELGKDWQMIPLENTTNDIKNYILNNLKSNSKIAIDYKNASVNFMTNIREFIKNGEEKDIELVNDDVCITDELIQTSGLIKNENMENKINNLFIHELKYSGISPLEKYNLIRQNFDKFYCNGNTLKINEKINLQNSSFTIVINKLDEIAWLTNLRGFDIPHNPVFFSYAILYLSNINTNEDKLDLYIDNSEGKFSNIPNEYFTNNKIQIKNINHFYSDLANLNTKSNTSVLLDKISCNYLMYSKILSTGVKTHLLDSNIIEHLKSLKNETELEGIRRCHKRDGASIVRYLAWLEEELIGKKNKVDEYEGAKKLLSFRLENELFAGESFDTISSSGRNSAIIHYKPEKNNCKLINPNEIYLLDSGGQYYDGTTDTTRTVHFGNPTPFEKEMYTRVLLGNLSIEKLLLYKNKNLTGSHIDPIARQYLWRVGEDYGHGTGHGVGHFLNVHEGPQSISPKSNVPFQHGMVTSNEPGFYLKGKFGIRIENVLLTLEDKIKKDYLSFENVTRINYDTNLINKNLLSKEIIDHVNTYHEEVFNSLSGILKDNGDASAIEFLKRKTSPI